MELKQLLEECYTNLWSFEGHLVLDIPRTEQSWNRFQAVKKSLEDIRNYATENNLEFPFYSRVQKVIKPQDDEYETT